MYTFYPYHKIEYTPMVNVVYTISMNHNNNNVYLKPNLMIFLIDISIKSSFLSEQLISTDNFPSPRVRTLVSQDCCQIQCPT